MLSPLSLLHLEFRDDLFWSRSVMLVSAESEHQTLISHEIILEIFQHM